MRFTLIIMIFFCIQSAFGQFDDYENKRRVKYFEEGNNIISITGGFALKDMGYQVGFREELFIKDGFSWGGSIDILWNHPNFNFIGCTNSLRAYIYHFKIRPFIEANHSFKLGKDFTFNAGVGGGVAIAGITEMLGLEVRINYEVPYASFGSLYREHYVLASVGINFQW